MSWIKRIGLWTVSVLAAEIFAISAFLVIMSSASTSPFSSGAGLLVSFIFFWDVSISRLVTGWLLALPLVLIFRRVDGWRFWILGTLVTLLGPVIAAFWSGGPIRRFDFYMAEWGLGVSFLSVVFYLVALRHFSRGNIEAAT
jgi:hypothetical protein